MVSVSENLVPEKSFGIDFGQNFGKSCAGESARARAASSAGNISRKKKRRMVGRRRRRSGGWRQTSQKRQGGAAEEGGRSWELGTRSQQLCSPWSCSRAWMALLKLARRGRHDSGWSVLFLDAKSRELAEVTYLYISGIVTIPKQSECNVNSYNKDTVAFCKCKNAMSWLDKTANITRLRHINLHKCWLLAGFLFGIMILWVGIWLEPNLSQQDLTKHKWLAKSALNF